MLLILENLTLPYKKRNSSPNHVFDDVIHVTPPDSILNHDPLPISVKVELSLTPPLHSIMHMSLIHLLTSLNYLILIFYIT